MRRIIYLISCWSLVILTLPVLAQPDNEARAKNALRRLAATYQQPAYLGFDVLYRYATAANPKQYLDSLRGQYKVHGNRYWSQLDSQETICNSELVLTVFKEDKLLFLAKAAAGGAPTNPAAVLDSVLLGSNNAFTYSSSAAEEVVSLQLPEGGACKKMTWYIDRKSGYLHRMESLMRSDQLYEPAAQPLIKDAASVYVVVETVYQHHRTGGFGDEVFDLGKYYRKEGGEYIARAPYEDYKVFLANTGL